MKPWGIQISFPVLTLTDDGLQLLSGGDLQSRQAFGLDRHFVHLGRRLIPLNCPWLPTALRKKSVISFRKNNDEKVENKGV